MAGTFTFLSPPALVPVVEGDLSDLPATRVTQEQKYVVSVVHSVYVLQGLFIRELKGIYRYPPRNNP